MIEDLHQSKAPPYRARPLIVMALAAICGLYLLFLASSAWVEFSNFTSAAPRVSSQAHMLPENDFATFWYCGKLLVFHAAGQFGWHLAPTAWMRSTFQIPFVTPTPAFHLTWMYPPPMGILAILYSLLPLAAGYWIVRGVFFAIAAFLFRRAGLGWSAIILGLAGPAELLDLIGGQNGVLTGALMAASLLLIDKNPRLAGGFAGLLCFKPQIALALPLIILAGRRRAFFLTCAASAALFSLLTLPIEGIDAWTWFFAHSWRAPADFVARPFSQGFPASGATVFFMARSLHAGTRLAWGCQAFASLIAAGLIWRLWRRKDVDALVRATLTILLWVPLTPYGYVYDLAGLSVLLAALFLRAPDAQKPVYASLLLAIGYSPTLANLTGLIWTPIIAAAGAAAIFGMTRHGSA